jgi:drug/metabolite transporter superfamily protein YnfA
MKLVLTIAGAVMVLLGGVWILQGINILPGSFMTGQIQWAIYGAVLAIAGVVVILWARRRPAA